MPDAEHPPDAHGVLSDALQTYRDRIIGALYTYLESRIRAGKLSAPPDLRQLAVDCLGDVAAVALERATTFDTKKDPLAWLLGIALNTVRGYHRDEARAVKRAIDPNGYSETYAADLAPIGLDDADWDEDDLFGRLSDDDSRVALEAKLDVEPHLNRLETEDAEVLRRFYDGAPLIALAAEEGVTTNTMKQRLFRARYRLRDLMADVPAPRR